MELLDYVGRIGVKLVRAGHGEFKSLCPMHQEKTPSFFVSPAKGKWICRGACNKGGDLLELIMCYEHVPFPRALAIAEMERSPRSVPPAPSPDPLTHDVKVRLTRAALEYEQALENGSIAWEYLTRQRGLADVTIRQNHVGLCPAHPGDVAPPLGNGHAPTLAHRVTIPEFVNGRCVYVQGRQLASGEPRYMGLPALRKPLYGFPRFQSEKTVYLVEGPFDWLTLLQWDLPAVSSLGCHLPASQAALLADKRVILAQDADVAGDLAARQIARAFPDSTRLRPPEPWKDWNDCLVAGWTREQFLEYEHRLAVKRDPVQQ